MTSGIDFAFIDMAHDPSVDFSTSEDFQSSSRTGFIECSRCRWGGCDVKISSCGCSYHAVSKNIDTSCPDSRNIRWSSYRKRLGRALTNAYHVSCSITEQEGWSLHSISWWRNRLLYFPTTVRRNICLCYDILCHTHFYLVPFFNCSPNLSSSTIEMHAFADQKRPHSLSNMQC